LRTMGIADRGGSIMSFTLEAGTIGDDDPPGMAVGEYIRLLP
jgi:hypothetical protein